MANDLSAAERDQLATLVARFDTELAHELEGILQGWADQNRAYAETDAINPRGKGTPEDLLDLAERVKRAREDPTPPIDTGRLAKLLGQLPVGGDAISLRKTEDGQWEVGWVGGMSGGEYGIRPTLAEAVELLWYEVTVGPT